MRGSLRGNRLKAVNVNEIFYSIQGEGKLAGMPSAFIRTSGCNLRCVWCDTPATSWQPIGTEMSVEDVLSRVGDFPTRHAVVTGGEPMIDADVGAVTRGLQEAGYHVTIETAGTVFGGFWCDLFSISPKLSNSTPWERDGGKFAAAHEKNRIDIEAIRRLMEFADYQLKFVVERAADLREIDELLGRIGDVDPGHVLLMPEGVTARELDARAGWVADVCKERGFRFCDRLHIRLFGNRAGT